MEKHNTESLVYEETPIIEPINEKKLPDPLEIPELSSHNKRVSRPISSFIGKAAFFILLFAIGVGGSTFVRPFLAGEIFPKTPESQNKESKTTITPTLHIVPVDETADWNEYGIRAGTNRLTYRLAPDVLPPACDGPSCPSEGTYLPGGTRFTISLKETAPISNFAKLIVKDAGGKVFETKETTVSGLPSVDYSGSFIGLTTGGYTFTAMHGVMIQITPTTTVEINHFAPNGITTEFEKDDVQFAQILETLKITDKISVTSTPSATVK